MWKNCCKTWTSYTRKTCKMKKKWKMKKKIGEKKYRMRWEWFKCNHIITRKIEAENKTPSKRIRSILILSLFSFYQQSFAKRQPRKCVCVCVHFTIIADIDFGFWCCFIICIFPNESHCIIVFTFAITTKATTTTTATTIKKYTTFPNHDECITTCWTLKRTHTQWLAVW